MRDDNFRWLIEEIREANDIADVIGEYLDLRNNKAVCPFHGDTNPSFSVNSQEQYFHCFGCRESGDVFKFLQLHEKLPFMEAVRQLADRAGIRPPSLTPEDLQELEETRLREEILTETADFYCRDLPKEIKGYLKKRSFTQNSIAAFHIGYASGGLEQHLLKQCKFTEEQCIKAGVLRKARDRTKDYFFNRTIFPNFKRGRCVHLTGRIVGPKDPKYLHLRGVIRHLFNEDAVHAVSDHRKTYFFGLSPTGHRSRQPRLWRGIGGNGSVQRLNRPQIEHRQRVGERRGAGELIVPPP